MSRRSVKNADEGSTSSRSTNTGTIRCKVHKAPCVINTSRTSLNPGRMFFSCPYWKSCHFFRWVDDEPDSDSRFDGLIEENHELKLKLGDMEALEGRVRKAEEKARKRKEEKAAILETWASLPN
ncbi:unnamed protein product [Linum trigynum]|uniref:GRF-type domain-containing protein n=1 Tax=Linum trigynum TaxID=586398 RepID=A0AAV2F2Q2_9ROSI